MSIFAFRIICKKNLLVSFLLFVTPRCKDGVCFPQSFICLFPYRVYFYYLPSKISILRMELVNIRVRTYQHLWRGSRVSLT